MLRAMVCNLDLKDGDTDVSELGSVDAERLPEEVGVAVAADADDVSGIWAAFSRTLLRSNFLFCVQQ